MNKTFSILDSPLIRHPKPWWQPFLSLFLTLYGVLFLSWNLQPIVFLFWWEIILMSGAAMVRAFGALNGRPFFEGIFQKLFFLAGGTVLFGAMIMMSVAFTIKAFDGGFNSQGFDRVPNQVNLLIAGYILGLILHYFANGRYKTAHPIGEMMQTLVHFLVLLTLMMVLTMHLIPSYPQLDQAKWVGVTVIVVKFVVDLAFAGIKKPMEEAFKAS